MTGGAIQTGSNGQVTLGGNVTATSDAATGAATVGGTGVFSMGGAARTFTVNSGTAPLGIDMDVQLPITGPGTPGLIKAGNGPYRPTRCGHDLPVCRWGDFSAASYDGVAGDHVWFAGQFTIPITTFSRNWGTWIGEI